MQNIIVINGHPNKNSFCDALAKTYSGAALKAGNEVVLLNLYELNFNPNFTGTYNKAEGAIEADILTARAKIKWAQHIVIIHPVWWGSVPALLKGFLDKALIPGFAFKYKKDSVFWDKLLRGKTAHIIYTCDTPIWYYRFIYLAPSVNMLRKRVLGYCGIKTKKVTGIGPIRNSTTVFREEWLAKVEKMGLSVN